MKTKEEIINETKRRFHGEFCYTALKCAMEEYAKEQVINELDSVLNSCASVPPEDMMGVLYLRLVKLKTNNTV